MNQRNFHCRVVVVVEGAKTEPSYFSQIRPFCREDIHLQIETVGSHSAPKHVLQKLKALHADAANTSHLELWAIIDRDHWALKDICDLANWLSEKKRKQECSNSWGGARNLDLKVQAL